MKYTSYKNCDHAAQIVLLLLSNGKHGFEVNAGHNNELISFNTYNIDDIAEYYTKKILTTKINRNYLENSKFIITTPDDHKDNIKIPIDKYFLKELFAAQKAGENKTAHDIYNSYSIYDQIRSFVHNKNNLEGVKICISVMIDQPSKHVFPIYYYICSSF